MALVARQSMEGFRSTEPITAPSYFTAAVNMAISLIIPIFITIFAAMLVASESSRGTLRMMLTRPISRWDFLTGKLLAGFAYLLLLYAANIATALLIARGYPLKSSFDRSISIPGLGAQIQFFTIALLLTLLPLLATLCFGFLISVLSVNVATSIGVAVGLLLTIQTLKEFARFGSVDLGDYVFLSYFDTAMGIAQSKSSGIYDVWNQAKVYLMAGTSILTCFFCLAISYWRFLRRDLNI
jgi:ABC-2 type transport system permease protein